MTDLNGKKIAIIATDRFEEAELVTPRDELAKAGAEVKIYSAGTAPIQAVEGDTEPTKKIDVDGTFGDLDVSAVDAVVVPGGTVNADHIRIDEDAQSIVREALDDREGNRRDLPRPWLLVDSGLANGRSLTSYSSLAGSTTGNAGGSVEGRGGRRGRHLDHQPEPRRPARLRRGDQRSAGRLTRPAPPPSRWSAPGPELPLDTSASCTERQFHVLTRETVADVAPARPRALVGGQLLVLDVEEDPHDHARGATSSRRRR